MIVFVFFFFKQKTAYEMRISDWSSDVCSSDLRDRRGDRLRRGQGRKVGLTEYSRRDRRDRRELWFTRRRGGAEKWCLPRSGSPLQPVWNRDGAEQEGAYRPEP